MPCRLESGKLWLSPEEVPTYRASAKRLHEACEMGIDLSQPITIDQWMFLEVAHSAIEGDLRPLEVVIAEIEAEIRTRKPI